MATRTKPLMKAAALAGAAAVAVATPALAPSVTSATSPALSSAKVNLTSFADLLSITPADWNNYYFNGWGFAIKAINPDPDNYIPDYWAPNCDYSCTVPGVSGLAYLALDALINGNGNGINDSQNWGVSAVNYFFEGSLATGFQYITESPFLANPVGGTCGTEGVTCGPLYNPAIANLIALAWQGPYALTTLYVTALSTVAQLASQVPYIGEYLYRGIGSYIGPAFQTVDSIYDYSYYAGISGVLRYIGGVITTGGNPNPYPLVQSSSAASTAALAAKAPAALSAAGAPAAETVASTPVADTKVATAPAESAAPTATTATATTSETKPADTASTTAANAVADTPAVTAPASKPAAAPAASGRRTARSAAAGVAKAVTSAVSGAASAAAGAASSVGAGASAGGASAAN